MLNPAIPFWVVQGAGFDFVMLLRGNGDWNLLTGWEECLGLQIERVPDTSSKFHTAHDDLGSAYKIWAKEINWF